MWTTILTGIKGLASAASAISTIDKVFGFSDSFKQKKIKKSEDNIKQAASNKKGEF